MMLWCTSLARSPVTVCDCAAKHNCKTVPCNGCARPGKLRLRYFVTRADSPDDPKPAAPPPAALQMWQRLPWWITAKGRAAHAEAAARGAAKEPNPKSRNVRR
jgi:hypothetical protein